MKMKLVAMFVVVLAVVGVASAEPMTVDEFDKELKQNPPTFDLDSGRDPQTICVETTCHRLKIHAFLNSDGQPDGYEAVAAPESETFFHCQDGGCGGCPEMFDFDRQNLAHAAFHFCYDPLSQGGKQLPRPSLVGQYCEASYQVNGSETHCEGDANGRTP
jgi:hypothetical protein